jgi:hypothetical protein
MSYAFTVGVLMPLPLSARYRSADGGSIVLNSTAAAYGSLVSCHNIISSFTRDIAQH